ncbi:MAG: TonB-dependent receptor [Spirosomataceae bacterium]
MGRPATGSEGINISYDYQQENYFTYRKKPKGHNITAILGNQIQKWDFQTTDLKAQAFSSDNIETFNNVATFDLAGTNTGRSGHSLIGLFSSASYDYKGKYLISGTLRRDGSSRFGVDKRYGYFPSGSIGWRISSENFMKGASSVVDNLLIKASYGTNGNERIGDYNSLLLYSPKAYYNGINTITITQLSNPNLDGRAHNHLILGSMVHFERSF